MRDWGELRSVVEGGFRVAERSDGNLGVTIDEVELALVAGVAFAEPWLIVVAPIVREAELVRPRDALELNAILSVGALALVDGMLALRWAWPLAPLDRDTLDRYLRFLARETKRLRGVHQRLGPPHGALDFLAD